MACIDKINKNFIHPHKYYYRYIKLLQNMDILLGKFCKQCGSLILFNFAEIEITCVSIILTLALQYFF